MDLRSLHRLCGTGRVRSFAVRGMTIIELMVSVLIVMVVAALAMSGYQNYRERIRVSQAVTEIAAMSVQIKHYMLDNQAPPASLADLGLGGKLDPWGRPYYYLDLTAQSGKGKSRRDK